MLTFTQIRIICANNFFTTSTDLDHPLQLLAHWRCPKSKVLIYDFNVRLLSYAVVIFIADL